MTILEQIPSVASITFTEYQRLQGQTSVLDQFDDPLREIIIRADEERTEVFLENGRINRFTYLFGLNPAAAGIKEEIAKELGDNLWFVSEYASRTGQSLQDIAADAVRRNSGCSPRFDTFRGFDFFARAYANDYTVINHKLKSFSKEYNTEVPQAALEPSLSVCPGYVLMRVLGRVSRQYAGGTEYTSGPPTNVDLDDEVLLQQSLGDMLWVTSGISINMLDTSLAKFAIANLVKAQRRFVAGTTLEGVDTDRSTS